MLNRMGAYCAATVETLLDGFPQVERHKRLVRSLVFEAGPSEPAHVNRVAQNLVGDRFAQRSPGAKCQPPQPCKASDLLETMATGRVGFEQANDKRCDVRVGFNYSFAIGAIGVAVADRTPRWIQTLLSLLAQPFLGLLGEVVDVVLGHQHLDAMHELLGRPRAR